MATRHRIPTIFNLSMVDVLCCALGCVILLWLVYFKEARERSKTAGETTKQLASAKLKLDDVLRDLNTTQNSLIAGQQQNEKLGGQLVEITAQRDQILAKLETTENDRLSTLQTLKKSQAAASALQNDLKNLLALQDSVKALLAAKNEEYGKLSAQYQAATQDLRALEKIMGDQKGLLAATAKEAAGLRDQFAASEKKVQALEQQAAGFQVLSKDYGSQLAKLEAKAAALSGDLDKRKNELAESGKRYDDLLELKNLLEKNLVASKGQLSVAQQALADSKLAQHGLEGETKVLKQRIDQLRAAADNRFAGIEMTGTRVLFLVDMSGSMRMKNNQLEDPEKWPLVCDVLGKLIKSLPDLKQFQVLLFSEKIRYPLANEGKWHDFHGLASVKNVMDAVRAETPQGATNMYAAMEEAFRFRSAGLDTIFLLSDGLPNEGSGLPSGADKLSDTEKSNLLAKHVRDKLHSSWNAPQSRWPTPRVRINTVGFYFDSPDVGAFLSRHWPAKMTAASSA